MATRRRKSPAEQPDPSPPPVRDFDPVPRKPRHDGWTPERQRAFIEALADTGSVTRACRYVNMSTEGAYWLRRQPGSESFRRAWEAALDLGVQRLKDIAYERAMDGQLVPVFVGGKLKGFRRVRSDRLLMFCLRMNARDERGRRLAASYFDPAAERLHGGSGEPAPRLPASITAPAPTRAEQDDRNAAIIEYFDPVGMTLEQIEAMQQMLRQAAARAQLRSEGPPEHCPDIDFVKVKDDDYKPVGECEPLYPLKDGTEQEFNPGEIDWDDLDTPDD